MRQGGDYKALHYIYSTSLIGLQRNVINSEVDVCPHWCELQISIVIGHVVEHVSHGNHHGWAGRLLLLFLFVMILFLRLLKTTERMEERYCMVRGTNEITGGKKG